MQGNKFFFGWEVTLMEWLQANMGSFGAAASSFLAYFGEEVALIAIIAAFYFSNKERGRRIVTMIATCLLWNPLLKNIFRRRRPYFDHPSITCIKPSAKGDIYNIALQEYSFPSGHATYVPASFGSIAATSKKRWLWGLVAVLSLLVGVSRVCLGVHYPTDVLVGWVLGLVGMAAAAFLLDHMKNHDLARLLIALTGVPGLFYCTTNDYFTNYGILLGFFAGMAFESRFVNFESTREPLRVGLRALGAAVLYFVLNTLLKLPFSAEWLESGVRAALLVRMGRYAVISFILAALYPMCFRFVSARFRKQPSASAGL